MAARLASRARSPGETLAAGDQQGDVFLWDVSKTDPTTRQEDCGR